MKNNKNLILTGFTCSGKSTIGKYISSKLNLNFIDTDDIIKNSCKSSITEIFNKKGEKYFRQLETNICKKICNLNNYVISSGGGTLINKLNYNLFKNKFLIVFIDTPFEICYKRISCSNDRPFSKIPKYLLYNLYIQRKNIYLKIANISISGDNLNQNYFNMY